MSKTTKKSNFIPKKVLEEVKKHHVQVQDAEKATIRKALKDAIPVAARQGGQLQKDLTPILAKAAEIAEISAKKGGEDLDKIIEEEIAKSNLQWESEDDKEIAGWFMGTRGENLSEVSEIILKALKGITENKALSFPDDPNYITANVKNTEAYKKGISSVKEQAGNLVNLLNQYSLPTQTLRYQAHMLWDITLPSLVGYFAALLQNQNNVTPQASPATTLLELLACNDIAQMIGFRIRPIGDETGTGIRAWGHISSGGSVANIESLWAAREVKFMPLGIKYALNEGEYLADIADTLLLPSGQKFKETTAWELLNLKREYVLGLAREIANLLGKSEAEVWTALTAGYSLNARGLTFFYIHHLQPEDIGMPALVVPSTKHYCLPKAAALLGMGQGQKLKEEELTDISKIKNEGLLNIFVDDEGKMKADLLQNVLDTCKANKKPVVMVVGVMGTTEEGAVDPLKAILDQRDKYRENASEPFDYSIHADAAWGGYFLTCLRKAFNMEEFPTEEATNGQARDLLFDKEGIWLRDSVYESMTHMRLCDSVTIDPHKMGYIPYPAGSLTYQDDRVINLLSFTGPYISTDSQGGINTRNIGMSGLEGSKPGAAPASVYLSHLVIRPHKQGYGKIINQSMLNSKLFYLYLLTMGNQYPDAPFEIVMFNEPVLSKREVELASKILWESDFHLEKLSKCKNEEQYKRSINSKVSFQEVQNFQEILKKIAGDQNLIDYFFIDKNNPTTEQTNKLNNQIFEMVDLKPGEKVEDDAIFVSKTTFDRDVYGNDFMNSLAGRLAMQNPESVDKIECLRSVIMDPWAIYTHGEDQHSNFFTNTFVPRLKEVVSEAIEQITEVEPEPVA